MNKCPFCFKQLSTHTVSYWCKSDTHEYNGSVNDTNWLLWVKDKKIQIGKCGTGHYIWFQNSSYVKDFYHIDPFSVDESLQIIEKYFKLRSFI